MFHVRRIFGRTTTFLDLNLDGNEFSIHRKPTFSGQYTHFESFVPWKHRTAWLRSLFSRVYRICSPSKRKQELQFIKRIASWNGFPEQVASSIMTQFNKPTKNHTDNDSTEANVSKPTLWFEMSYIGQKREQLLRTILDKTIDYTLFICSTCAYLIKKTPSK